MSNYKSQITLSVCVVLALVAWSHQLPQNNRLFVGSQKKAGSTAATGSSSGGTNFASGSNTANPRQVFQAETGIFFELVEPGSRCCMRKHEQEKIVSVGCYEPGTLCSGNFYQSQGSTPPPNVTAMWTGSECKMQDMDNQAHYTLTPPANQTTCEKMTTSASTSDVSSSTSTAEVDPTTSFVLVGPHRQCCMLTLRHYMEVVGCYEPGHECSGNFHTLQGESTMINVAAKWTASGCNMHDIDGKTFYNVTPSVDQKTCETWTTNVGNWATATTGDDATNPFTTVNQTSQLNPVNPIAYCTNAEPPGCFLMSYAGDPIAHYAAGDKAAEHCSSDVSNCQVESSGSFQSLPEVNLATQGGCTFLEAAFNKAGVKQSWTVPDGLCPQNQLTAPSNQQLKDPK